MGRTWGRLYSGTRNHRKIRILRQRHPTMWFAWYVLIELAIECDDDGWIYVAPDRPYTWKELAQEIGTGRSDNAERFIRTLIDLGLASYTEGKGIRLTSYSERNYESDSSTARVQKYRERKKSEGVDETFQERSGNVSVTDQNRNRTEQNKVQSTLPSGSVTPPAADPPPPTKRKKSKPATTTLPDNFSISPEVHAWAAKHGHTRLEEHLEAFKLKAVAKAYQYADWDSAFKTAIRENWAKLDKSNGAGDAHYCHQHPDRKAVLAIEGVWYCRACVNNKDPCVKPENVSELIHSVTEKISAFKR